MRITLPAVSRPRKLQKAIAEATRLSVAADLIEESLGVTNKAGKA
jgi:hypothetical protein